MDDNQNDVSTEVEAIASHETMTSTTVAKSNTNTAIHTLMDLLTRWVFVETFQWTTTNKILPLHLTLSDYKNAVPQFLKSYRLPQMILDNSALIRQKLNNYMLLKSDVEIDVKVNANPFQQGALLIAYFPRSLDTSSFRGLGSEFLASVTSAPHTMIYLEQGNTAKLTLPYANIVDYIDISSSDNAYGSLNIYCLSSLEGASDVESADITVRARFVNPQLEAPTDNSILMNRRYAEMELERNIAQLNKLHIHGAKAQSKEGEKTGPVSRIANTVEAVASAVGWIPGLSTAATAVGWVARGVGKVASAFGWSKATDLTLPTVVIQRPGAYMGNVEGKDYSNVLAQIADNAIDSSTMTPETEDEMALAKIWQRPNAIGRFTVPKQNFTARKLLFSWEVSPWSTLMAQLDSQGQDFALGSFSFSTLMYRLWRGSIHYTLNAVKTPYHSGRIMAVYFPNRTTDTIPDEYDETMTTNNNTIFDLTAKADDEFSLSKPVKIPYTSNEPWKRTMYYDTEASQYRTNTLTTHCGVVGVYCVNELVSPDTVSDNVTFILQHQAGEDFEVGIPQIQLQGGFAPSVDSQVAARLSAALNANMPTYMYTSDVLAGGKPNFYKDNDDTIVAITQGDDARWNFMEGVAVSVPDGTYTTTLTLLFGSNFAGAFDDGDYEFSVYVQDAQIGLCSSGLMLTNTALTDTFGSISTSVPLKYFSMKAQAGEGGSDPTPQAQLVAPIHSTSTISEGTTGEYALSLRPLLKRTIHTCDLSEPVTITPVQFNSVRPEGTNPGTRAWVGVSETGVEVGGGELPESWVNLISYLYRFSAGSTRSKIFLDYDTVAKTSLVMDDQLEFGFGQKRTDPMFVQVGINNFCLETTLPYYSQYRARTIGDQARGLIPTQYIELTGNRQTYEYHEAGGDDLSYFFMVGPPVMRGVRTVPITPPTIQPQSGRTIQPPSGRISNSGPKFEPL